MVIDFFSYNEYADYSLMIDYMIEINHVKSESFSYWKTLGFLQSSSSKNYHTASDPTLP